VAAKKTKPERLRTGDAHRAEIDLMLKGRDRLLDGKAPKRRRSSKRKPMTLASVARSVDPDLASAHVKASQPVLQLTVPTKVQKSGMWFTVAAHETGESLFLRLPAAVSVRKERLNEALKLLRRLHELG
jgi:hypothetical protein